MKKQPAEDKTLEQSLEWVMAHPHATNQDVPENLRAQWISDESQDGTMSSVPLTVFVYGFTRARVALSGISAVEITASEILEHFQAWQMKLALAELHHRALIFSSPVPLFIFSADETVHVVKAPELSTK